MFNKGDKVKLGIFVGVITGLKRMHGEDKALVCGASGDTFIIPVRLLTHA